MEKLPLFIATLFILLSGGTILYAWVYKKEVQRIEKHLGLEVPGQLQTLISLNMYLAILLLFISIMVTFVSFFRSINP